MDVLLTQEPAVLAFFIAVVLLLLAEMVVYGTLSKTKPVRSAGQFESISVVIAARNEAENLMELVPMLFEQEYPEFEVVVVDDCSYDNSHDVLLALQSRYKNLKAVFVKDSGKFDGGKKFALTLGIKAATNDNLVFTDADCRPKSNRWLQHYGNAFASGKNLVLGYGAYDRRRSFLNALIRIDTLQIALQYFGLARLGTGYMGVGRNIGYTKELFYSVKGFSGHMHIQSGDDDLFVAQVFKRSNPGLLLREEASTVSVPETSFKDWFNQKRRHITTSARYSFAAIAALTVMHGLRYFYYITFVMALLWSTELWGTLIGFFVLACAIRTLAVFVPAKLLGEQKLVYFAPVLEPVLLLFYFSLPIANKVIREIQWRN